MHIRECSSVLYVVSEISAEKMFNEENIRNVSHFPSKAISSSLKYISGFRWMFWKITPNEMCWEHFYIFKIYQLQFKSFVSVRFRYVFERCLL